MESKLLLFDDSFEKRYSAYVRISHYINSFDGTKIAIDAYLPSTNGNKITDSKVPTILICRREQRRKYNSDNSVERLLPLVYDGYALVVLELRGCGVSYGINDSFGSKEHCEDIAATSSWIRKQVWSNGLVAMQGASNRAYYQLCTISRFPKSLDVLTMGCAVGDMYYNNHPNGVSCLPTICFKEEKKKLLSKEEFYQKNDPVDEDIDGQMGYEAYLRDQYPNNHDFFSYLFLPNVNRDSKHPKFNDEEVNMTIPPIFRMRQLIGKTDFKQLQLIGQFEPGPLDQLNQFMNYGGQVIIGPWDHMGTVLVQSDEQEGTIDFENLMHTWFDYSLKGKENAFSQMPPVLYYMNHADKGKNWRVSDSWPLENERRTKFYLSQGELVLHEPEDSYMEYQTRLDTVPFMDDGKSKYSRMHKKWDKDMREDIDDKALVYTSKPLWKTYRNEMVGCVSVDLWLSSDQNDVDLIVYLEEVYADGSSHYINDGFMRASHRTKGESINWEKMGATWHTSMTSDVEKCLEEGLEEPVHLQFAIDPICWHFKNDSRLRISITCANTVCCQHTYQQDKLPKIKIYEGKDKPSFISVPFIEKESNVYVGKLNEEKAAVYYFEKHVYLNSKKVWKKYGKDEFESCVHDGKAYLKEGVFFFTGKIVEDSLLNYEVEDLKKEGYLPFRHALHVAKVNIREHDRYLFAPNSMSIDIDMYGDESVNNSPCLAFLHGYGGRYNQLPDYVSRFLKKGYKIATINMRDYPPARFPEPLWDMKACLRYLRCHSKELKIDADKIGFIGCSFGGNASLMAALSGDLNDLEGNVGGNLEYSSSVQAAVAGFAWSDLLQMGPDLLNETFDDPNLYEKRKTMTDGQESPSAEIIGFSGSGKGLAVLRESDGYQKEKEFAEVASPLHYVQPGLPPILLYGGFGEKNVNIACKQSYRTFEALAKYDDPAHLTCNTQGHYSNNPESDAAIESFFDRYLKRDCEKDIFVFDCKRKYVTKNYVAQDVKVIFKDDRLLMDRKDLEKLLNIDLESSDEQINLYELKLDGYIINSYPKFKTVIIQKDDIRK